MFAASRTAFLPVEKIMPLFKHGRRFDSQAKRAIICASAPCARFIFCRPLQRSRAIACGNPEFPVFPASQGRAV
jgi:hypothetical protein